MGLYDSQANMEIKERFDTIHEHYDLFNHIFSFGLDIGWRKQAAATSIIPKKSYDVLDVAIGTGDLAIAIDNEARSAGKRVRITGMDMNSKMLRHARRKIDALGLDNITLELGDALSMRYKNSSFDVVTSGFAMRSFVDLGRFGREAYRVMRRGGKLVMLDMAMPENNVAPTKAYFKVIDAVGSATGKGSYKWLTRSVSRFDKKRAARIFRRSGFKDVSIRNLRSGVAFIITGRK